MLHWFTTLWEWLNRVNRMRDVCHPYVRPGWQWSSVLAILGIVAARSFDISVGENFHPVIEGRCYRSGQPDPEFLERLAHSYQVRTILCLRGFSDGRGWMEEETETAEHLHLRMLKFCFSSINQPPPAELGRFVEAVDHQPEPMLIHCHSGADRTGLASALYLLLKTDATPAEARHQLNLFYGHALWGKTHCQDEFFDCYEAWLSSARLKHKPDHLRYWVRNVYGGGLWLPSPGGLSKSGWNASSLLR